MNRVLNADFPTNTDSWSPTDSDVSLSWSDVDGTACGTSGSLSVSATARGPGATQCYQVQQIDGMMMRLDARVFTPSGPGEPILIVHQWQDYSCMGASNGGTDSQFNTRPTEFGEWRPLYALIDVKPGTKSVSITLAPATTSLFDQVYLYPLTAMAP